MIIYGTRAFARALNSFNATVIDTKLIKNVKKK